MKGVESVIAIILILMIVIALAALAYTWFTGVFSSLTSTAGTAVTQTTGAMSTQFSLETAQGTDTSNAISVAIRNTGTNPIDQLFIEAYINDAHVTDGALAGSIAIGVSYPFSVTSTIGNCFCHSDKKCYTAAAPAGTLWILTITIGTGLQQRAEITC